MSAILEVDGLVTKVNMNKGAITLVEDISFRLEKGEAIGLVGESGCGKSVTALSLMRLLSTNVEITSGSIRLNERLLTRYTEKEMQKIRGKELAMIFQDPMTSLNPVLTVGHQIGEVLKRHEGLRSSLSKEKVIGLLKQVGIPRPEQIYQEYPHRLSGGMRQRVMIAMAIACSPSLLIADEPTTALDVTIQSQILDLLTEVRRSTGMSLIMITHDFGVVAETCDKVMVMYAGQVVESADVRTLLRNPRHPYTRGLLNSLPEKTRGSRRLYSIPGSVPAPGAERKGCRFAPRCDRVMPICREHNPELKPVDEGSQCRCWLYQSEDEPEADL
ncbi:ABC transporter ATP-binding protein [Paenibacillus senegalensis]|uniref:ABC transporter ATP-binding protein n=1 Tax=Paenibacillus senegalensis TaxID=1465766 RepID=UPI00028A0F45|nr:ABC transporter ATP-binding protein [Paenibacillus senegalensis]